MNHDHSKTLNVAVLIPCYNEELSIATVVSDFKAVLPHAVVYVYDNNSTDQTAHKAELAGATVRFESNKGKGNVVRRMFSDIDADIYLMTDGDDTYDAKSAPEMIEMLVEENLDMVVGTRVHEDEGAYRKGHILGNRLFTTVVGRLFSGRCEDILSGYRVMSRRFVRTFPALSRGFEIETELTVHALELRIPIGNMPITYKSRPEGSSSKLSTHKDGMKILWRIVVFLSSERPFLFFSTVSAILATTSITLAFPVVMTYLETGLVPRFPTAILSVGLMLTAVLSFFSGLILKTVTLGRKEIKHLIYLTTK